MLRAAAICFVLSAITTGCSTIQSTAVNMVGNALSGGGDVFTSDNDPQLVREALPFGLKTYESLLEVSPEHRGVLLATANGFTAYAFFIQQEADRVEADDLEAARNGYDRAKLHYVRGRDYALRGLEASYPGFANGLYRDREATLAEVGQEDIDFLYWAGASWAGAVSVARDDPELIADLPIAGALVARVLELDEAYERGTAHEFFVSYEGSRPGGSAEDARRHYARALELSMGERASVHLALAETVVVTEQNVAEFRLLLDATLDIDPERTPEIRLLNILAQQRAEWLRTTIPTLFVEAN